MKTALAVGAAALALSASMLAAGYWAGSPPAKAAAAAGDGQPTGRAAIEMIVRDYLVSNPEVMVEVQTALKEKQELAQRSQQIEVIKGNAAKIFDASYDGVLGNPNGRVTLVEFFDFNCGYCKRAVADMDALIASDPELRVVMKEFPILGDDSRQAHVVSMAFRALMPDKWHSFHEKLIRAPGRSNEASALAIALELGADEAALRDAMKDPAITAAFQQTYELAGLLAIEGTPSYVVGNEVVFGAFGKEVLAEKVAVARACEGGAC